MKLKHITFTGIDSKTSVYAIQKIQNEWPIAEFGILLSRHWDENGPRYPSMDVIRKFLGMANAWQAGRREAADDMIEWMEELINEH